MNLTTTEPARTSGTAIRRYRKIRGLLLKELAATIGISSQYLANIEHGRRMGSPKTIFAIAQALNVQVQDITVD